MTLQQFFQEINEEEFVRYYVTHDIDIAYLLYYNKPLDKIESAVKETLRLFKTKTIVENPEFIFFVLPYHLTDEKNYSFFCKKDEILTQESPEHYSVEEVDWDTALGSTLSHYTYFRYFDKLEVAYELFNSLTFMGFTEEEHKRSVENQYKEIQEALESITDTVMDFKDTMKELGVEDFEIESDEFDDEFYRIETEYSKSMLNLFIKYEKNWLQENELLENNY